MKDNTRYEKSWIIMGGVLSVLFLENDIKPIRQNTTIEFCRARRFRRLFIIFLDNIAITTEDLSII